MTLRDRIRKWLGITNLHDRLDTHRNLITTIDARVLALESTGLADIRSMANIAQSLDETDPRRLALSDVTNDYLVRKAHAEAQVRQHFGYGPEITKDQS